MSIESELQKAKALREQKANQQAAPALTTQQIYEQIFRDRGVLGDLEYLKTQTGDPKARIDVTDEEARLTWGERVEEKTEQKCVKRRPISQDTQEYSDPVNQYGNKTHHKVTHHVDELTYEGYKTKTGMQVGITWKESQTYTQREYLPRARWTVSRYADDWGGKPSTKTSYPIP